MKWNKKKKKFLNELLLNALQFNFCSDAITLRERERNRAVNFVFFFGPH